MDKNKKEKILYYTDSLISFRILKLVLWGKIWILIVIIWEFQYCTIGHGPPVCKVIE